MHFFLTSELTLQSYYLWTAQIGYEGNPNAPGPFILKVPLPTNNEQPQGCSRRRPREQVWQQRSECMKHKDEENQAIELSVLNVLPEQIVAENNDEQCDELV